MMFVIPVVNTNPTLGPVQDGMQSVGVYDTTIGNRRTVLTTQEKADEFIAERNAKMHSAESKGLLSGIGICGAGSLIGSGVKGYVNGARENKRIDNLNNLVDTVIPKFKETLDKKLAEEQAKLDEMYKSFSERHLISDLSRSVATNDAIDEVLAKEPYKKYSWDLKNLFNKEKNTFVKMGKENIGKLIKEARKDGAFYGLALAMIPAILTLCVMPSNAENKVTQKFIEENK